MITNPQILNARHGPATLKKHRRRNGWTATEAEAAFNTLNPIGIAH